MTDAADRKRAAAESFGAASDAYRDSDVHRQGADLERLASWCAGADRALDVATGAGHTAGALLDVGVPRVVALDASPGMVATAVGQFDAVTGVVGDAERLPFAAGAFDAVSCRIAPHHFPEPVAFVDEVSRVLRPGGTFALEDTVAPEDDALGAFINGVERRRDPAHVESYPISRRHEWLDAAGFVVEETVHLQRTLAFDAWAAAQSLPADRRTAVEELLLGAGEEAAGVFEIRTADGTVTSFANRKGLVRATRAR